MTISSQQYITVIVTLLFSLSAIVVIDQITLQAYKQDVSYQMMDLSNQVNGLSLSLAKSKLQSKLSPGPEANPVPASPTTNTTPTDKNTNTANTNIPVVAASVVSSQFEQAFQTKQFNTAKPYFKDLVSFTIYATECCGKISPTQSLKSLEYTKTFEKLDFNQANAVIKDFKASHSSYKDFKIGISTNKELVAYKLDNLNKIESVFVVSDYTLME